MKLNTEKLDDLILHLGASPTVKDLGMTKLWKLIYFIDAEHLREYGETLTGSEYIKYDHGPVPSRGDKRVKCLSKDDLIEVKSEKLNNFTLNKVITVNTVGESCLTDNELIIINRVCNNYGTKTATYLSDISHDEPSWIHGEKMQKLSEELMHYGSKEDAEGL